MTTIFEEALLEAKKLRQVAEEDAKNTLIQEMTPAIRKIIASQLAGKSNTLFEEALGVEPAPVSAEPEVSSDPTGDAGMPVPASPEPAMSNQGAAPIKVAGADVMNMPMPGADGKLVIDLDDLFVPSEPGSETPDEGPASAEAPPEIPGGMPSPTPVDVNPSGSAFAGEGEAMQAMGMDEPKMAAPAPVTPPAEEPTMEETYELFAERLTRVAGQIHQAYSLKEGVPSLVKEALQERLYQLLESLEELNSKSLISPRLNQIQETRLEILHRKLKEAVVANTYHRTEEGTGTDMASKSLKEMAAKLLAESDSVKGGPIKSPADVHKTEVAMKVDNSNDAAADKAGTHAKKVTEPSVTLKTEAAEAAAQAALAEELVALVSEDSGESLVAKEGEQDLAGAASTIPDKKVGQVDPTKSTAASSTNPASHVQGVSENIEHSKETGSEQEVGKSSTGHPVKKESVVVSKKALAEQTKKIKAEALKKQISALQEQLKECGMSMEGDSMSAPGMEDLGGGGETVINFNFDLADLVPELQGLGDDDEIEVVGDEPSSMGGADVGSSDVDEFEMDLDDAEEDEPEDEPSTLAENRKGKPASRIVAENKNLRSELAEQKVFNAKVVHFQPFVNNRNLTKEQKQKIAEHLDRGTTLEEVKAIYNRVKVVVEKMQKVSSKAGSSSKAGVTVASPLNESANPYEGATLVEAERNRLMQLAGIKRK
jgi:hypothetical protein